MWPHLLAPRTTRITAVTTPIGVPATNIKLTSAVQDHASEQNHPTAIVTPISVSFTNTMAPVMSTKPPSDLQSRELMSDHPTTTVITLIVPVTSTYFHVTNVGFTSVIHVFAVEKDTAVIAIMTAMSEILRPISA